MKQTTYSKILSLLSDGQWHHSNQICEPQCGGRQGISRISEMRKLGKANIIDRPSEVARGNEYKLEPEQAKLI